MENNNSPTLDGVWTPISDVNDHILSFLSVNDLLACALTCKGFMQYLERNGSLKALEKLIHKYDLEYLPQNIPWAKLLERCDKIDNSIRKGLAIVNCLVAQTTPTENNPQHNINAVTSNEEYIALGWTFVEGFAQEAREYVISSVVLDIRQRDPIKTIDGPNILRIFGEKLAKLDYAMCLHRESFHYFRPLELQSIQHEDEWSSLCVSGAKRMTLGVMANRDPSMKHLVAIVSLKSNDTSSRSDLEIAIFDTNQLRILTNVVLVDVGPPAFGNSKPINVVFKGNSVYYSENMHPVPETTLHIVDWTNNEHKKMKLPGTWSDIYGVHKSLVYGTTAKDWNDKYIFVYDMKTGRYLDYKKTNQYCSSAFDVLCGYLVYSEDTMVHFIDYRSDKLEIVSSLMVTNRFGYHFKVRIDGTLLLGASYAAVTLLDFENTCDVIEVMQMTGVNGETKTLSFPAHELSERMSAILGEDFVSRYYKLKKDYRCGIIYRREQTGPQLPLSQKYFKHRAQYNTPYRYHQSGPGFHKYYLKQSLAKHTEVGLYGTVVFFYEKWDGQRFKLAKPQDWAKLLLK